jgi:site-specific recombinase XerD
MKNAPLPPLEAFGYKSASDWLRTLSALQRSLSTIESYSISLRWFFRTCRRRGVDAEQAGLGDVYALLRHMDAAGLANATVQVRLCAVRQWFDHLMFEGVRDDNPIPKGQYRPPTYGLADTSSAQHSRGGPGGATYGDGEAQRALVPKRPRGKWIPTDDEWRRFVASARTCKVRDRLMVGLAYDGALRRCELVGLELRDFDVARQRLTIRPEISKGWSGPRTVMFSGATARLLGQYARLRRELSLESGPLLLSESNRNRGAPLSKWSWNDVVFGIAERSGLRPHFTTHTFRHLRLTHLARKGWEAYDIKTYAGHSSLASTMEYIHLSGRDLAEKLAVNVLSVERAIDGLDG